MTKKKVLSLLHSFFNRAGTEKHAKCLARVIYDHIETFFVAYQEDFLWLLDAKGNVLDKQKVTPLSFPKTELTNAHYDLIFRGYVDRIKPDIIHVHHIMNWPVSVLKIISDSNIPWILSVHDYYLITPHYTMQGITDPKITLFPEYAIKVFESDISLYLKERRSIINECLKSCRTIIAPSKYAKCIFQSVFSFEVLVKEHLTDIEVNLYSLDLVEADFGYIGSFLPQKGVSVILQAFNEYRKKGGSWHLHMFGGQLEAPIDGVYVNSVYDDENLYDITKKFAVGIIPSIFPETFCLTLSELWMHRKPVIASSLGALTERINNNPDKGWLFKAGDYNQLSDLMLVIENEYQQKKYKLFDPPKVDKLKLVEWGLSYYE